VLGFPPTPRNGLTGLDINTHLSGVSPARGEHTLASHDSQPESYRHNAAREIRLVEFFIAMIIILEAARIASACDPDENILWHYGDCR
jgi:hypothetical protein